MLFSELELAGSTEEAATDDFDELDEGAPSGIWLLAARLDVVVCCEDAFADESANVDEAPLPPPLGGVELLPPPQAVSRVASDTAERIRSE